MKTVIAISSLILLTLSLSAQFQQNPPTEFRVVAVSNSDSTIQSVSNEISLYKPMKLHFPSAFTPNQDGLNDSFGAVGEGIEKYKLTIYNQWGQILFSSLRVTDKWDGSYKGKKVPFGTYNYEVLAYGKEFGQINQSGAVIVLN